jgi:hypothetical protein
MANRKLLTNADGDVRELTSADFKRMRPAKRKKPNPELIDEDNPEWTAADFARARSGSEVLPAKFLEEWRNGNLTIRHVSDEEYEASKGPRDVS